MIDVYQIILFSSIHFFTSKCLVQQQLVFFPRYNILVLCKVWVGALIYFSVVLVSIDSCDGEPVFPLTARATVVLNRMLICLLHRHHLHHLPLDRWTPDTNNTHTHTPPDGGLKTLVWSHSLKYTVFSDWTNRPTTELVILYMNK